MPKLHLITYGCQMNEYDSERVAGLLRDERYELTETAQDADLILLNTCAIREKCEDMVFSRLGELKHLKRERPHVLIGVMGCMAQLWQGKIQERAPAVDLVFGSAAVSRVGELVARARDGSPRAGDGRGAPRQDHRSTRSRGPAQGLRHRDGGLRERVHLLRGARDPGP